MRQSIKKLCILCDVPFLQEFAYFCSSFISYVFLLFYIIYFMNISKSTGKICVVLHSYILEFWAIWYNIIHKLITEFYFFLLSNIEFLLIKSSFQNDFEWSTLHEQLKHYFTIFFFLFFLYVKDLIFVFCCFICRF